MIMQATITISVEEGRIVWACDGIGDTNEYEIHDDGGGSRSIVFTDIVNVLHRLEREFPDVQSFNQNCGFGGVHPEHTFEIKTGHVSKVVISCPGVSRRIVSTAGRIQQADPELQALHPEEEKIARERSIFQGGYDDSSWRSR